MAEYSSLTRSLPCESQSDSVFFDIRFFPPFRNILEILSERASTATIVGGAIRDRLLGGVVAGDLDIVVEDHEVGVVEALCEYFPMRINRHGNWRFDLPGGQHADLWTPLRFYRGFPDIMSMISFFDFSVNAIGLQVRSGRLIDPVGGLSDIARSSIQLIEKRWVESCGVERFVLRLRLIRVLEKFPVLGVVNCDAALREFGFVESGFDELAQKYVGLSATAALVRFRDLVGSRSLTVMAP